MNDADAMKNGTLTAGGAVLARLHRLGVEVVFANSGTDFPPIIEGLAEAEALGHRLPRAILVPHEHAAVGMAQGYASVTGQAQAVILHTNVGLANGATATINAATDQVPMILLSGRTPTTERGRFGSRTVPIGWGQEMRDQASLVREATKWDYELRFADQIGEVLDRANAIACSTPTGPTYLSLPREVLCEPCPVEVVEAEISMRPSRISADQVSIDRLAELLVGAEHPLIVAQRGAGDRAGFDALARIAERFALPVCQYWAVGNAISADHPCAVGSQPEPWLSEADVVVVLDSLAPWMPDAHGPSPDATVVQLGPDPLYSRFPIRNFRADLAITSEVGPALVALETALENRPGGGDPAVVETRRDLIGRRGEARREALAAEVADGTGPPMSKAFVGRALAEALERDGNRSTVLAELGVPLDHLGPIGHDAWRQEPHSGGLGWGLPCAMGIKLADPDRLVVATMGDGSYLFANPVACHHTAAANRIPVLTVVLNNGGYGAVRDSVLALYPTGYAAKADEVPLTALPGLDVASVAGACGAVAERVEGPDQLAGALDRGIDAVQGRGRQAVVEVMIGA